MTSSDRPGARWTLRVGAAGSGVCFLLAVLELSWTPRPGPLPPGTEGGAFSVGHGLWGIGVRADVIVPLVLVVVAALTCVPALGRRAWASAVVGLSGAASLAIVASVATIGSTFVLAEVCAAGLTLAGVASVIGVLRDPGPADSASEP